MRRAESRGIDGWARNRPDGSVEAVLAGQEEHILALISECREGPGSSIVTDVIEVTGAEDPGSGFRITA
jgi:acylphosphatase